MVEMFCWLALVIVDMVDMVEMFCWLALVIVPYTKVVRALGSEYWLCADFIFLFCGLLL